MHRTGARAPIGRLKHTQTVRDQAVWMLELGKKRNTNDTMCNTHCVCVCSVFMYRLCASTIYSFDSCRFLSFSSLFEFSHCNDRSSAKIGNDISWICKTNIVARKKKRNENRQTQTVINFAPVSTYSNSRSTSHNN